MRKKFTGNGGGNNIKDQAVTVMAVRPAKDGIHSVVAKTSGGKEIIVKAKARAYGENGENSRGFTDPVKLKEEIMHNGEPRKLERDAKLEEGGVILIRRAKFGAPEDGKTVFDADYVDVLAYDEADKKDNFVEVLNYAVKAGKNFGTVFTFDGVIDGGENGEALVETMASNYQNYLDGKPTESGVYGKPAYLVRIVDGEGKVAIDAEFIDPSFWVKGEEGEDGRPMTVEEAEAEVFAAVQKYLENEMLAGVVDMVDGTPVLKEGYSPQLISGTAIQMSPKGKSANRLSMNSDANAQFKAHDENGKTVHTTMYNIHEKGLLRISNFRGNDGSTTTYVSSGIPSGKRLNLDIAFDAEMTRDFAAEFQQYWDDSVSAQKDYFAKLKADKDEAEAGQEQSNDETPAPGM